MPEVAGAFPVLWYPGELQSAGGGSSPCGKGVAVLAEPSQQSECDWLGEIPAVAADLCATHTQNRPQHLNGRQGSKVMRQRGAEPLVTEEPDALIAHVRVCGGAGWVTTGSTRKPRWRRRRSDAWNLRRSWRRSSIYSHVKNASPIARPKCSSASSAHPPSESPCYPS